MAYGIRCTMVGGIAFVSLFFIKLLFLHYWSCSLIVLRHLFILREKKPATTLRFASFQQIVYIPVCAWTNISGMNTFMTRKLHAIIIKFWDTFCDQTNSGVISQNISYVYQHLLLLCIMYYVLTIVLITKIHICKTTILLCLCWSRVSSTIRLKKKKWMA